MTYQSIALRARDLYMAATRHRFDAGFNALPKSERARWFDVALAEGGAS